MDSRTKETGCFYGRLPESMLTLLAGVPTLLHSLRLFPSHSTATRSSAKARRPIRMTQAIGLKQYHRRRAPDILQMKGGGHRLAPRSDCGTCRVSCHPRCRTFPWPSPDRSYDRAERSLCSPRSRLEPHYGGSYRRSSCTGPAVPRRSNRRVVVRRNLRLGGNLLPFEAPCAGKDEGLRVFILCFVDLRLSKNCATCAVQSNDGRRTQISEDTISRVYRDRKRAEYKDRRELRPVPQSLSGIFESETAFRHNGSNGPGIPYASQSIQRRCGDDEEEYTELSPHRAARVPQIPPQTRHQFSESGI